MCLCFFLLLNPVDGRTGRVGVLLVKKDKKQYTARLERLKSLVFTVLENRSRMNLSMGFADYSSQIRIIEGDFFNRVEEMWGEGYNLNWESKLSSIHLVMTWSIRVVQVIAKGGI